MLNRTEVVAEITFKGATPNYPEVLNQLATKLSTATFVK